MLQHQPCRLDDLFPGLQGHELGKAFVSIPQDGYSEPVPQQLAQAGWVARVHASSTYQGWHWVGPGDDSLPDSCIVLQCAYPRAYSKVVINITNKQRARPESASLSDIQKEAAKLPAIHDKSIVQVLLYVTDQRDIRPTSHLGIVMCPIFRDQQEAGWGGALEIRDVLWGARKQRTV
jgi:hypothetical protein